MRLPLAVFAGSWLLAGCATLLTPGTVDVPVDSRPDGATVWHAGRAVGVTPCVVAVGRADPGLELRRDGCHPRRVELGMRRNPLAAWNVTNLGVGLLVDAGTGATRVVDARPVLVPLARREGRAPCAWRRPSRPRPAPDPVAEARRQNGEGLARALVCLVEALACGHD